VDVNFVHHSTGEDISPIGGRSKNTMGGNDSMVQAINGIEGESTTL
jgi:hypothetical protein